jgi:hypothetical protein
VPRKRGNRLSKAAEPQEVKESSPVITKTDYNTGVTVASTPLVEKQRKSVKKKMNKGTKRQICSGIKTMPNPHYI